MAMRGGLASGIASGVFARHTAAWRSRQFGAGQSHGLKDSLVAEFRLFIGFLAGFFLVVGFFGFHVPPPVKRYVTYFSYSGIEEWCRGEPLSSRARVYLL